MVAQGASNAEIAVQLQLGQKTVRNYVSRLYQKLDLHSRSQIVTHLQRTDITRSASHTDWATSEDESSVKNK